MMKVRISIKIFCNPLIAVLVRLQQPCLLGLTGNAKTDGQRWSRISTSLVVIEKHQQPHWQIKTLLHHFPVPWCRLQVNSTYIKKVTKLWKAPISSPVNISGNFSVAEYTDVLQKQSLVKLRALNAI